MENQSDERLAIFVDFDDTLCLHNKKIQTEKYLFKSPDYICVVAYKESIPNTALHLWLKDRQREGALVFMMTNASRGMWEAKKMWLDRTFPDVIFSDYIFVNEDADKESHIRAYTKMYPEERVYFIDDDGAERAKVEQTCGNVITYSPQWLMAQLTNDIIRKKLEENKEAEK